MKRLKCQGFSVIEFMVAITLGTLLIASAGAVYLSNKSTYVMQEGLARLQENGRYANFLLSRELRMAGFQGCANQKQIVVTNLVRNVSSMLAYDKPVQGYDGLTASFSPLLPANLTGKPMAGSDIIEVRMASNFGVQLRDDMNQPNNPILVYDRLGIAAGDPVMITNCSVGDIFIAGANTNATAITHTVSDNTTNDLTMAYPANSQVMRFLYYAFYVKNTGRVNSVGQPILALVRLDINGNEDEIAEGVELMRISYGVDTNGDNTVDTYQTATQVNNANNWNNVISIQINLLFATTENVNDKVQPYTFNGTTTTPTDRKLRRQWDTFITLRNRGLPS
ncbi:PilW family protein [Legionella erythra]|uniref:Type IV fimbrial biogenesis PilW-like protein n=1 Tax=Legionella erythra TaxID=448 RepID=A0A0W0TKV7_LEGER|nr:PilW family protein [Legionella erythra]KTC95813.1 type IV fimbrial biogenesis PilW-like protein [Legionella erythra]